MASARAHTGGPVSTTVTLPDTEALNQTAHTTPYGCSRPSTFLGAIHAASAHLIAATPNA